MTAEFDFSMDIEFLFPYLNAVAKKAQSYENPPHIRFNFDHTLCVLHPDRGLASPFDDNDDARAFIIKLIAFLNDINQRKDQITPRYKFFSQTAITQILKLLPQINCNECGSTNMEIAQSLNISPHTVKSHINHIFNKLSVNSRTQASVWATQHHFV